MKLLGAFRQIGFNRKPGIFLAAHQLHRLIRVQPFVNVLRTGQEHFVKLRQHVLANDSHRNVIKAYTKQKRRYYDKRCKRKHEFAADGAVDF